MPATRHPSDPCDAWNPGLNSTIPAVLQPQVTLFRSENAFIDFTEAQELSDFCGLRSADLISLRPERLLIHELLIRVSADLSVPDGPNYEDLGINLRAMVATIYNRDLQAELPALLAAFEQCRSEAQDYIDDQLARYVFNPPPPAVVEQPSWWQRLISPAPAAKKSVPAEAPEIPALASWQQQLEGTDRPLHKSCLTALISVVGAIVGHRGRLPPDPELVCRLATNQVCNQHGSAVLGALIEPLIKSAAVREGYRYLPEQTSPVIMNVKGASASGKSTIRPQQTRLAGQLGIPWQDFALISPDYWRKYLLDYSALGSDYKYAAMLTGQELEIIDKKLDRYMAEKATRGKISHLLIDRFRFDSFSVDGGGSSDSRLLSRFGDRIFMFFMVTPPAETVVRAWERGKTTGRYKAVDDLLYHNVEAFTGMPALFFSWVLSDEKKRVHFEFLDNDVPLGQLPKTAAFGWNNCLTILDVEVMLNIDRYRKVNVDAAGPTEVFKSSDQNTAANSVFLSRCISKISDVTFADQDTAQVYARFGDGKLTGWDSTYLDSQPDDSCLKQVLEQFGYDGSSGSGGIVTEHALEVSGEKNCTLGRWGMSG